jgi:hypothetical protein
VNNLLDSVLSIHYLVVLVGISMVLVVGSVVGLAGEFNFGSVGGRVGVSLR